MRMKRASRRKATNISLPEELVAEARALDINLSREVEAHLADMIRKRRAERWREENQQAIEAYSEFVEKFGIFNEDERGW